MDERVLTPSTSVLTVLVVGMFAGHVLMPARAGATVGQRTAFLLLVAAAGTLGGWRIGRLFRRAVGWLPAAVAGVSGALVAIALAAAGYAVVHG